MTAIVENVFSFGTLQKMEERVRLGLEKVFGGCARILYDVQTLNKEGFEKFTKVVIANLKFLGHHTAYHPHFRPILPVLEAQRSLYLCTRSIGATADLFPFDPSKRKRVFKLPRIIKINMTNTRSRLDVCKICNIVVNYLETAHFMIKHKITLFVGIRGVFEKASHLVVGSQEIGQLPGLHFFFQKPKEALAIWSSVWDMGEMALSWGAINTRKSFFRLAGDVGRLALIALGRHHPHTPHFALLDATLANMGLISFLWERSDIRKEFYE